LHVIEIGAPAPKQDRIQFTSEIQFEEQGDSPVLLHGCPQYGLLFIVTKKGYLLLYEASRARFIYKAKFTDNHCFAATRDAHADGLLTIDTAGRVFSIDVNPQALVQFIFNDITITDNEELSLWMAGRFNLAGAAEINRVLFEQRVKKKDYQGAANIVKECKALRSLRTLEVFKR